MLDTAYLSELKALYERELLENILPFWLEHARDRECGGYHTCLNRDGSVYDYDKASMWHAGRIIWTYAFLYNEFRQEPDWLEMARWGVDFVQKYGFAPDGSMYYALDRQGRPLRGAQDVFTELSTVLGFTEYARATGQDAIYEQAKALLLRVWGLCSSPGQAFQGMDPATRPARLHGHSMITLNVVQELRRYREEPEYERLIDQCLDAMLRLHLDPDRRVVFELVGWDGDRLPGYLGRWVNPGHMIEGGIFVIGEGRRRSDAALVARGVDLIDWGFERGWDTEFGGIFNDVDADGLPVPTSDALRYDAKLWWQHAEALYAMLLAYCVTGEDRFLQAYRLVHDYSFSRFADPEYGEWIAMLDRRGNPVNYAKGLARKSPFHIARNFYGCYAIASESLANTGS
ncbi:MAG: AGE family epimerase/isomerase [Candidatus Hydrogenedentes bacterium]|nr:AGE family epimerase/isomerase [Candidatus Hydrogenedentota bacterium]